MKTKKIGTLLKDDDDISAGFPHGWKPKEPEPGSPWATKQRLLEHTIENLARAEVEAERERDPFWWSWNSMRKRGSRPGYYTFP